MLRAHAAYVDRLEAAHSAVVLDLHTREVAYGVGHRVSRHSFKLLPRKGLHGQEVALGVAPRRNGNFVDCACRRYYGVGLLLVPVGAWRKQAKQAYDSGQA